MASARLEDVKPERAAVLKLLHSGASTPVDAPPRALADVYSDRARRMVARVHAGLDFIVGAFQRDLRAHALGFSPLFSEYRELLHEVATSKHMFSFSVGSPRALQRPTLVFKPQYCPCDAEVARIKAGVPPRPWHFTGASLHGVDAHACAGCAWEAGLQDWELHVCLTTASAKAPVLPESNCEQDAARGQRPASPARGAVVRPPVKLAAAAEIGPPPTHPSVATAPAPSDVKPRPLHFAAAAAPPGGRLPATSPSVVDLAHSPEADSPALPPVYPHNFSSFTEGVEPSPPAATVRHSACYRVAAQSWVTPQALACARCVLLAQQLGGGVVESIDLAAAGAFHGETAGIWVPRLQLAAARRQDRRRALATTMRRRSGGAGQGPPPLRDDAASAPAARARSARPAALPPEAFIKVGKRARSDDDG